MKHIIRAFLVVFVFTTAILFVFHNQTTTYATTIKINQKKLTLLEGKTYSLVLTGTNKTIKWSSSNKKVATVSNKGKVKAVSQGKAIITATVNNKKYNCSLTVKKGLSEKEAVKNISYEAIDSKDHLIVILENKNNVNLEVDIEVCYYNDDVMVYKTADVINTFQAGKTAALLFDHPYVADEEREYSNFKISFTVALDSKYTTQSYIDDIVISKEIINEENELIVDVINKSKDKVENVKMTALFYADGQVIGATSGNIYDLPSKDTSSVNFHYVLDNNYKKIKFDEYEIYINEAYNSVE